MTGDVTIYESPIAFVNQALGELAKGLLAHGMRPTMVPETSYRAAPMAVFAGWVKPDRAPRRSARIIEHLGAGSRCLVLERGFVGNRERHHALGWALGVGSGLGRRLDFRVPEPALRTRKLPLDLQPWREDTGEHVLLLGQVPWDAQVLASGQDYVQWLARTCAHLRDRWPVVFRPHPKMAATPAKYGRLPPDVRWSREADLWVDMIGARCVVALNSNGAVDAVLAGMPAVVLDEGAMAWDVAGHDLAQIDDPPRPSRHEWASWLAHTQWTNDELASGAAWEQLR